MNDLGNIVALSFCVTATILVGWILWTMVLIPGLRYRREARERRLTENDAALRCAHGVMRWKACGKCAEEFSRSDPLATGAIPGDTTAGGRENRPQSVTVEFQVEKEVRFGLSENPTGDVIAQGNWVSINSVLGKQELQANPPNWPACGVCGVRELDSHLKYVNHSNLRVCQKCFNRYYIGPPMSGIVAQKSSCTPQEFRLYSSAAPTRKPMTLAELDARLRALIIEAGYPVITTLSICEYKAIGELGISISVKKKHG